MYEPTEEDILYAKQKGKAEEIRVLKSIQYRENNIEKRKSKGLKINKITSSELRMVLLHWFSGGRKPLTHSFKYVYKNTDKINKEVDWVEAILRSKSYGKELVKAFNSIDNREITVLKNSKLFDMKLFTSNLTLSKRISKMHVDLTYEDGLLERDLEIERLKGMLKLNTWQDKALSLLKEGKTQKEVSVLTGKSLATIARLVAKNKGVSNENKNK